jgi:hypothetical protein
MSDFTIPELAGSAAFCVLILDKTFSFVSKMRNGKPTYTNGAAGEKSTDYWKAEFRSGVREELQNQGIPNMLREIRDGINQLVIYEEMRQRDRH